MNLFVWLNLDHLRAFRFPVLSLEVRKDHSDSCWQFQTFILFLSQVTLNNAEVCSENITTLKRNLEVHFQPWHFFPIYFSSIYSDFLNGSFFTPFLPTEWLRQAVQSRSGIRWTSKDRKLFVRPGQHIDKVQRFVTGLHHRHWWNISRFQPLF